VAHINVSLMVQGQDCNVDGPEIAGNLQTACTISLRAQIWS